MTQLKPIGRGIPVMWSVFAGLLLLSCTQNRTDSAFDSWQHYGGSPEQSRFFEGDEITKENVHRLEVSWTYPIGDDMPNFFSPLVVDTVMYLVAKNSSLVAVNVNTGEEIWIHANLDGITRRGINYWESEDRSDRRLLFTINNTLQAINADTGETIMDFGQNGYVDLRESLDREGTSVRRIQSMMPGVLYEDLLILGSSPGENYFSPPGHIRAYNVRTGALEWKFRTIPHPEEYGYETWPKDAYKYVGGANVWSEMSVDTDRGIVFLPVGSPTYDYYGADRLGSNLFGNSLVAVNARTGERLWHFQTLHHDLWDYDLASAPQLITIDRDGKRIDAVAVASKHGMMFVFDRETGEPLFPIEEKPFPPSEMPGEEAWPTQPISSLPRFTRNEVTVETLNPYFSDSIRNHWIQRLQEGRSGLYIPPSDKYELIAMPGALGGANYGNAASFPDKGMVYLLTQEHASIYKLNRVEPPRVDLSGDQLEKVISVYASTCQTCHGVDREGGVGPSLTNIGDYIFYGDFKEIVLNGKGQMPGFVHMDEESMLGLFKWMGGNPRSINFRRSTEVTMPEGPVVGSGGAAIADDENKMSPMADYPEGVERPTDRYTTDYGLEWPALAAPPWSSLVAYDLNEGLIRWRRPVGIDSLYANGDPSAGAPSGVLRKGMVVTSTGIVFATAKGGKLYAFDSDNGEILWETTLSHESNAQPIMYTVGGKQYLVVNASSNFTRDSHNHSIREGALPKGYVVFGLPEH